MSTKSILTASTIALGALVSTAASAGTTGNWTGFYVDAGIGMRATNTKVTQSYAFGSRPAAAAGWNYTEQMNGSDDTGKSNFMGRISLGYRYDTGSVLVGGGLFIDMAGSDAGKGQGATTVWDATALPITTSTYGSTYKLQQKTTWGLNLEIAPNWQTHPYLKVAYSWSKFEYDNSVGTCNNGFTGATTNKFTQNNGGFGVGAGVRHLQTENLYYFAEIMYTGFGSKSHTMTPLCATPPAGTVASSTETAKMAPKNVVGLIGIGYKF